MKNETKIEDENENELGWVEGPPRRKNTHSELVSLYDLDEVFQYYTEKIIIHLSKYDILVAFLEICQKLDFRWLDDFFFFSN